MRYTQKYSVATSIDCLSIFKADECALTPSLQQEPFQTPGHALLLKWLCLCLGKLCQDAPEVRTCYLYECELALRQLRRCSHHSQLSASPYFARVCCHPQVSLLAIREGAADLLVQLLTMASPVIRAAAVFGLGCLVHSLPSASCVQTQEEVRGPVRAVSWSSLS